MLVGLALIVLGGAFVKPVITGTVAKSSDEVNRARAFSIFYMVVNIGSFTGKTIVAPMRIQMGVETVPFFSAGASPLRADPGAAHLPPPDDSDVQPKNMRETLQGMWMAMSNVRFLALILITAGFWAIQGQLYASMPDYVLRMAGETYKPEWYANINPLVVVIFVVADHPDGAQVEAAELDPGGHGHDPALGARHGVLGLVPAATSTSSASRCTRSPS